MFNIEDKQEIIDKAIIPFLHWTRDAVFIPLKTQPYEHFMSGYGAAIGITSSYVFAPLGGDFGNLISDVLSIENLALRKAIYSFFASNAVIPAISLSCVSSQEIFKQIVSPLTKYDEEITKNNMKRLKIGVNSIIYIMSAFAGAQRAYLTADSLKNSQFWETLISIPAFTGAFLVYRSTLSRNAKNIFNSLNQYEFEVIRKMRISLMTQLKKASLIINSMNEEEILEIYKKVLENKNDSKDIDIFKKLSTLYGISKNQCVTEEKPSYIRRFMGAAGVVTGGIASYAYYNVGVLMATAICNFFQIEDPTTRQALEYFCGIMVSIPVATMYGITSKDRFETLYDFFNTTNNSKDNPPSHPILRKIITIISVFEGLMAGVPNVYLTVDALKGKSPWTNLLAIPAFTAHASFASYSVNQLFLKIFDWIINRSQITPSIKKEQLVNAINLIAEKISTLPDHQILALYESLNATLSQDKEVFINIQSEKINTENTPLLKESMALKI